MVPADMVLLASCNDQGSAFIETSSIDGETNLKLRLSPTLPKRYLRALKEGSLDAIREVRSFEEEEEEGEEERAAAKSRENKKSDNNFDADIGPGAFVEGEVDDDAAAPKVRIDSIEDATKRLTRISYLGNPNGKVAIDHPDYKGSKPTSSSAADGDATGGGEGSSSSGFFDKVAAAVRRRSSSHQHRRGSSSMSAGAGGGGPAYVAALTTEPPNPSVHTFLGKITLPPLVAGGAPLDIALDAENVLLRGAVVRNTEWVIGVVFFTGTDTKLVQNSVKAKSKFSQLDILLNKIVAAILVFMLLCIVYLASFALVTMNKRFDELWYAGYHRDPNYRWPYLQHLDPPKWSTSSQNWLQYFFLNVTLLTNFVPLSLYVTVEFVTFCMLGFIYADIDMYDDTTNTRAVARSTIVSDLGRIQYIFSDKTGEEVTLFPG